MGLDGNPGVTEDIAAHPGSLQAMLEHRQPFSVFRQKSYSYTLHWLHSVSRISMLLRYKGYAK